ncbi:DNA-binding transcriptional LysR family regulator [Paraburkholderia sp. GAS448]|uniref:hypothetical protein n=1 Tax=Paraburkholderia sp. GAS448 TaxID=3035136 RepID=UPI003D1A5F52
MGQPWRKASSSAALAVCRAPLFQVCERVEAGKVEVVLAGFEPEPVSVHLACSSGKSVPRRARALIDFLAARLSAGMPVWPANF